MLHDFDEVSIEPHRTPEIFLFLVRTSQKVKLKTASRKLLEKSHVCASETICSRFQEHLHLTGRCVHDIGRYIPGHDHEGKAFRIIPWQWEHAVLAYVFCRWVDYPGDFAEILDDEKIRRE